MQEAHIKAKIAGTQVQIVNMKFPFKYRILVCFILLLGTALVTVLLFSYQWCSQRAQEHIDDRLNRNLETLRRIHKAAVSDRTQRYSCLATEPRFQALAEIQDKETLQFAASEVRQELRCAAFAFLNPNGEILAWDGEGKEALKDQLIIDTANRPEPSTELFFIGDKALEVTILSMHVHGVLKGYLLGARVVDSSILEDYSLAVDAIVELREGDMVIATSHRNGPPSATLLSSVLPLTDSLCFVVKFDPESVTGSLHDVLRAMIYVSSLCILIGGIISLVIADRFARPIQYLTTTTQAVGEGDLSGCVRETGSPEFRVLARNFNGMIQSLQSYQEQLKDRSVQLEEQVKEKTRQAHQLAKEVSAHEETMEQLREAVELAEEASKAKDAFLANMSHELRTPLHGILSFSRFGIKYSRHDSNEKLGNYFKKINYCGETLLHLLNDLLDLAKLESGKMDFDFKPIDLNNLIDAAIGEVKSQIDEKNLHIQYPKAHSNSVAICDSFRISQVIRNLLGNAIKFTANDSFIIIELSSKDELFKLSVQDQGPGIPDKELDAVFDKFIQSSETKTGAGGTGLGLAICREIIGAHKGRIWAENRDSGGAIFSFEIPKERRGFAGPIVITSPAEAK